ncbi:MAG: phosphoheptose isomerase [Omnitrophica bacterium RIFCSPLOWO2_12_FULL_44_17]|uniref:Phosphoheptose isomerase n=1 Tax=Candidatus Danuiimicrobium aquiferis TaxID=1801832 RepID=A0A1G1KQD5_9BACT|nr:MAG: phosphoheptose isomerase [Omnitrophica bacterium RIFCSPHIGHO2_02_FULL_45_28]OGW92381.1 MAG: phosphoheptose isomerase [Omnitrophica bacterium RIFCSPHIGHO2_12_FULL_44_12]OGW95042.1 MAG: phosphoheptose isomerase [Omnitrophica bacterium RIFCSPLOWO2_12_FULL_44_17]OGX02963.1 MAG: phosphoheptose isomerase [Omnitrophica bacterium RIFCSPLOWO2_02_FULL_44_11]
MEFWKQYFNTLSMSVVNANLSDLDKSVKVIKNSSQKGGKIIIVGNGGSAAMASHVAVDLTKVAQVSAITFNDADLITCFANDYGYENWVEKGIEFYSAPDDVAVLISSSGKSENILRGAKKAKERGLKVLTFSGFNPNNPLRQIGNINFWVDSKEYNIVEMTHQAWLLGIVDKIAGDKRR